MRWANSNQCFSLVEYRQRLECIFYRRDVHGDYCYLHERGVTKMKLTSEQLRDDFHYLFRAEVPALKELVRSLLPNPLVVNLGAGAGTSGLAILEARDDVTLITVDIEDGDSPLGSLYSERDVMKRAGFSDLFGVRWFQIHEDSKVVGGNWDTQELWGSVDCVFIDAGHQEEECRGDIEAWLPHAVPGGLIVIHDYQKDDIAPTTDGPHWRAWPGVDRAVRDLLLGKYEQVLYVDSLIAFRIPSRVSG